MANSFRLAEAFARAQPRHLGGGDGAFAVFTHQLFCHFWLEKEHFLHAVDIAYYSIKEQHHTTLLSG